MPIGYISAISAAILWGLIYTIDQKILSTIPPMTLVFINSIIGALIMLPFVFFSNSSIQDAVNSTSKINWLLIIFCVVLASLANFLIFFGIKNLDASTASIIEIAYPFFVVLFSWLLFRSTPNIYFFIGGALICIGSIVIIKLS